MKLMSRHIYMPQIGSIELAYTYTYIVIVKGGNICVQIDEFEEGGR